MNPAAEKEGGDPGLPGTKHFHTKGKVHISRLYKDIKDQPL